MDPSPSGNRFYLIQAMRGIAALWVVLFHIYKGEAVVGLTSHLPDFLTSAIFGYGSAGVAIFFVLSGFVICHSLHGKSIGFSGFLMFAARRSVRIDPPYWASIVLAIGIGMMIAIAKGESLAVPSPGAVLLHMFYLQGLSDAPAIQIVYWTLVYEVQFYLVYAFGLFLKDALRRRGVAETTAYWLVFSPLIGLGFLSAAMEGKDWAPHGLFVDLWHGFLLGVLAYEAGMLRQRTKLVLLLLLCIVTTSKALFVDAVFGVPCVATALLLLWAARSGWVQHGLASWPWQALGTVSYSLYLVHLPVLTLLTGVWQRVAGRGAVADTGGLFLLLAACLLGATVFWYLVERPSQALASRLRRKPAPAVP